MPGIDRKIYFKGYEKGMITSYISDYNYNVRTKRGQVTAYSCTAEADLTGECWLADMNSFWVIIKKALDDLTSNERTEPNKAYMPRVLVNG